MELGAAAGESGNNILGGRLKESHNIGDEFVLALDDSKGVELVGANVNGFFYICCLERGERIVLFHKVLDKLCRSIGNLCAHQGCGTGKGGIEFAEITFEVFKSFVKKSVLYNNQLHVGFGAGAAKIACLLGVEACGLHKVEVGILLEDLGDFSIITDLSSFLMMLLVFNAVSHRWS